MPPASVCAIVDYEPDSRNCFLFAHSHNSQAPGACADGLRAPPPYAVTAAATPPPVMESERREKIKERERGRGEDDHVGLTCRWVPLVCV